ncbi:MAG: hypothetical protein WDZ36_03050 [Balneolaceae bacterium]
MLQTFYNNFGFAGALLLAFGIFIFFIFWMAGLAGIWLQKEKEENLKIIKLITAVFIPLYPFFWMILDMYKQMKMMNRL